MSEIKHERSYYWFLTINNPLDYGFDHDKIESVLTKGQKIRYYCISDEIGETGTFHTHVFAYWENQMRFTTLQKYFEKKAHIDFPNGTPQEVRDYVFKEGKWINDPKGETNIRDSHIEFGDCPIHQQGKRTDLSGLYQMIKDGYSNYDILERDSNMLRYLDRFDKIRKTIQTNRIKDCWRELEVTYIWGITGSGKTRGVMEEFGYSNVYRVTDYLHPFDGYSGQDVILFEEFRSSLRIDDMLKYLDGYPVELACRYSNQQALFTKVFFATNIDLRSQYPNIQKEEPETWKAFLRRIGKVSVYLDKETVVTYYTSVYMNDHFVWFNGEDYSDYVQSDFEQIEIDWKDI